MVDFNETEEVAIAEIPRAGLVKMEPRDEGIERVSHLEECCPRFRKLDTEFLKKVFLGCVNLPIARTRDHAT